MTTQTIAPRREANKIRTRDAVVAAAYALLHQEGASALTAERVADAAGISRRTFFNYFPSVEAVIVHRHHEILADLGRMFAARPAEESLTDSAKAIVADLFTVECLHEAVATWRAIDDLPAASRYALEALDDSVLELAAAWAEERRPGGADPLRNAVLAASALAAFDTARRRWLADHVGPVDRRACRGFVTSVHRAFEVLRPALDAS